MNEYPSDLPEMPSLRDAKHGANGGEYLLPYTGVGFPAQEDQNHACPYCGSISPFVVEGRVYRMDEPVEEPEPWLCASCGKNLGTEEASALSIMQTVEVGESVRLTRLLRESPDVVWEVARTCLAQSDIQVDSVIVGLSLVSQPSTLICTLINQAGDTIPFISHWAHHPNELIGPSIGSGAARNQAVDFVQQVESALAAG